MGFVYEFGVFDDMEEMIWEEGVNCFEFFDEGYCVCVNCIK